MAISELSDEDVVKVIDAFGQAAFATEKVESGPIGAPRWSPDSAPTEPRP